MRGTITRWVRAVVRLLEPRSQEDREKRAACLAALLLVAATAAVRRVTGLTVHGAPFTFFALAVAASAALGGIAPGIVATLASVLAARLGDRVGLDASLLFAAEGTAVTFVVFALRVRLRRGAARLADATASIADLTARDRRRRVVEAALQHLEEVASDTAVVVLDERGRITEWRASAARLYGYRSEDVVGKPLSILFADASSPGALAVLLHRALESGSVERTEQHRRGDGSLVEVEVALRPLRAGGVAGFTVSAHDVAVHRAWEDYRQAAARAQAALQQSADEVRAQLSALESLTDPTLNAIGGAEMLVELLERLRATTRADGAALLQPAPLAGSVVAARGVRPAGRSTAGEAGRLTPGRVDIVQNDAARVAQLSAFRWPSRVTSLLAVPVVHDGQVWSVIELVSEQPRRLSDWEVALARVVADRLAPIVVLASRVAAKAS